MADNIFTTRVKTNLNGALQMTIPLNGIMMSGDGNANQIIVELYDGSEKVLIPANTKIVGYFIRADDVTVEVDGSVTEDGEALVVVPELAYEVIGPLIMAVRLFDGSHIIVTETGVHYIVWDKKMVIAALKCYVQTTETGTVIDIDHHVPDIQELLEYIEEIDRRMVLYEQAETNRNTAEQGRVTAESQRQTNTQTAINKINNMTVELVKQDVFTEPTISITDLNGAKHITFGLAPGDPFTIRKVFSSIAEMNAYTGTDVKEGQFVIIDTGDVEDPDNAKLFLKTTNSYSYITDLSGKAGIQGPQGPKGSKGSKGDKGDKGDRGTSVDIAYNGTTETLTVTIDEET